MNDRFELHIVTHHHSEVVWSILRVFGWQWPLYKWHHRTHRVTAANFQSCWTSSDILCVWIYVWLDLKHISTMVTLCVWKYVGSEAYIDDGYSLCLNIRWIWSIYGRWLISVFEYTLDLKHIWTMVTLCVCIYVGSEAYIDDGYSLCLNIRWIWSIYGRWLLSVFEYTLDLKHIWTMVTVCVWIYVGSEAYMDDGYSLCLNIRWI